MTDEESAKYLDGNWRIRILNCGRPLFHNADERPLAVCDYYTVNEEELISADRASREYVGEIYYMQYNERQQWYWISGQKPDEIQLFVNYLTTRIAGRDRLVGSPEPSLPETHPDRAFRYTTFFIFEQVAWTKREAKAEPRDRHYCDHEEERGVNANVTEVHS